MKMKTSANNIINKTFEVDLEGNGRDNFLRRNDASVLDFIHL